MTCRPRGASPPRYLPLRRTSRLRQGSPLTAAAAVATHKSHTIRAPPARAIAASQSQHRLPMPRPPHSGATTSASLSWPRTSRHVADPAAIRPATVPSGTPTAGTSPERVVLQCAPRVASPRACLLSPEPMQTIDCEPFGLALPSHRPEIHAIDPPEIHAIALAPPHPLESHTRSRTPRYPHSPESHPRSHIPRRPHPPESHPRSRIFRCPHPPESHPRSRIPWSPDPPEPHPRSRNRRSPPHLPEPHLRNRIPRSPHPPESLPQLPHVRPSQARPPNCASLGPRRVPNLRVPNLRVTHCP